MPVPDAARSLGVPVGTLRRWVREGCPAQRGRRGRGCATLVDPDAVRLWRDAMEGDGCDAVLIELAASLPGVLAVAAVESWRLAQGVDKRCLAGVSAGAWYLAANAALDLLRERCPSVPHLSHIPEEIERLRKIEGQR